MSGAALPAESSYWALSPDNPVARRPRSPARPRPEGFASAFDSRTIFYDCFWHADGARALLVGPPPQNLKTAFAAAKFVARPGGQALAARFHASLSVMITELRGVPAGTIGIEVTLAGETAVLRLQLNQAKPLAGRRLLFSVNRDNTLEWVREWALFHARVHGTDAIILVDNGSTAYEPAELQATLLSVPGIVHAAVPVWPHKFGPIDPAVRANPYWARFFQIGSMSMVLRRYGELSHGLLDCDVDELAGTRSGRSIYDLARESRGGLVAFRGTWIEATGGSRHRDFAQRHRDPKLALSARRKWALDPSRHWVRRLSVHPYWHWIEGRPLLAKSMPPDALYWHFKGINTNWKQDRTSSPDDEAVLEIDPLLAERFSVLVQ